MESKKKVNKPMLLPKEDSTKKKSNKTLETTTVSIKNSRYISFLYKSLHKLSSHLNELNQLKFLEQDEYNTKMQSMHEIFLKVRELDETNQKKKGIKQNYEIFHADLLLSLRQLVSSVGSKEISHLLQLFTYYQHDHIWHSLQDDMKEYLHILDHYFIPFSIQTISEENEKNSFIEQFNLQYPTHLSLPKEEEDENGVAKIMSGYEIVPISQNKVESNELPKLFIRPLQVFSSSKIKVLCEKLDGATIIIFWGDMIVMFHGIFRKDSLGLCKWSQVYFHKMTELKEEIDFTDVPREFREKYVEQLSLRDFVLHSSKELSQMIKSDYQELMNLKNKTLSLIIKEFIKSPPERQRKILILFILHDDESKFNANIIFDLIWTQNITYQSQPLGDILYKSFHWKIQKMFQNSQKSYEESKKKIESLTVQDVPYETRIASLQVSDYVKSKAMDKVKEINGSKESSNKAQQWLDGFLKIPFGNYKQEPILIYFKEFQENLEHSIQLLKIDQMGFKGEKNLIEKEYDQIFSEIIDAYDELAKQKSEYNYEVFLQKIQDRLQDISQDEKTEEDLYKPVPMQRSHSLLHHPNFQGKNIIKWNEYKETDLEMEEEVGMELDEEEKSPLWEEAKDQLTKENQELLKKMMDFEKTSSSKKLTQIFQELDEFRQIKEELVKKKDIQESTLDLLTQRLEEIEKKMGFWKPSSQKNSSDETYMKFVIKNKAKLLQFVKDWNDFKKKKCDYLQQVENILDKCTYGQYDAKKQMKRLIAQWMNGANDKGSVIGLQGPPGVGKTSLLKHGLSKCLLDENGQARPLIFVPIGGSSNGSFLEGHNYTYLGSTWGKIADALMESKCMNPIIFIDELDKISKTEHGKEIASILTHITDETQNHEFFDRYFASVPIDLSKVLFVFSYNDRDNIDPILRDRIQEIQIRGLSKYEKIVVCKNYILPEIYKNVGFGPDEIIFSNETLGQLIEDYTFEEGARKIKEILLNMVRDINLDKITGKIRDIPFYINQEFVDEFMEDKKKIKRKTIHDRPMVGICNGLYAVSGSSGIGGITPIQMMRFMPNEKKLSIEKITGSCGEDMVESVNYAFTLAINLIPEDILKKVMENPYSIHVHCGDSGKKSGPSAGAVITTTFVSLLTGIPIKHYFCGTSEVNLCGKVTAIGGLEAKLNGAIKAGCTLCCISTENEEDLRLIIKKDKEEKAKMVRSESMKSFDLSPVTENESFDFVKKENQVIYKGVLTVCIVDNIIDFMKVALVENDIQWNSHFITKHE